MPRLFTNNAATTLAAGIASGATSITVVDGSKFPTPSGTDYFDIVLTQAGLTETSWETVRCTARSGNTLTVTRGVEGTAAAWASGDKVELRMTAGFLAEIGFRSVPQNSQSAPYTCVLADSGCHILHPSSDATARTFTIPANASVAFPVGTTITFVNQNAAGVITIAITTDTMRLSPTGLTGNRTLAANGIATALKVSATEWLISGNGLS